MLCVYRFKLIVLSVLLRTKIKNRGYITPIILMPMLKASWTE